jgi:hypothetical protein
LGDVGPYFALSGLATFALSLALLAVRRPLDGLSRLLVLVGPVFGIGLVWLVDQSESPTTTGDRVVLIVACVSGSLFAAWPIPVVRWIVRALGDSRRRLAEADRGEYLA